MELEELKQLSWKKYIATKHWRTFRDLLLNDVDCECQICKKRRWSLYKKTGERKKKPDALFNVHHKHYNKLGEESREDVMVLCHVCHDFLHTLEVVSRTRGGIFADMYKQVLEQTEWRYIPFKESKK